MMIPLNEIEKAGYYVIEMPCGARIIKKVWPVTDLYGNICGHRILTLDGLAVLDDLGYRVVRRVPDEILEGGE